MFRSFRLISLVCIVLSIVIGFGAATAQEEERPVITADNAAQVIELDVLGSQDSATYTSLALSPDGAFLAVGTDQGEIYVWDVSQDSKVFTIQSFGKVVSLAYSPDGTILASASWDSRNRGQNTVYLYDGTTGEETSHLDYQASVTEVSFSPDGTHLVTASNSQEDPQDYAVRFWDVATGEEQTDLFLSVDNYGIRSAQLSSDGTQVAFGFENVALLFNAADHTQIGEFIYARPVPEDGAILPGHWIVQFSNATVVFIVSDDLATLPNIYFLYGNQVQLGYSIPISDQAFSWKSSDPNACEIKGTFTSSTEVEIICDAAQATGNPSMATTQRVRISPDGSLVVTGHDDGTIQVWDVTTGEIIHTLNAGDSAWDPIKGIVFSPDGTVLISISSHGKLRLWEVSSGTMLADLTGYETAWSGNLAIPFDGSFFASIGDSEDRAIRLWGIEASGEETETSAGASMMPQAGDWETGQISLGQGNDFFAINLTVEYDDAGNWKSGMINMLVISAGGQIATTWWPTINPDGTFTYERDIAELRNAHVSIWGEFVSPTEAHGTFTFNDLPPVEWTATLVE